MYSLSSCASIAAKIVRSRQIAERLTGFETDRERPCGIRAAIDQQLRIERAQAAGFIGVSNKFVVVLTRVCTRDQMLAAILDEAKRLLSCK